MALNSSQRIQFVLSCMPSLVIEILKNLSIRDLYRCSQVCKLWSEVVQEIKRSRCEIVTFMKGYHSLGPIEDSEQDIISKDCWDIGAHLVQWLEGTWTDPNILVIFGSPEVFYNAETFFPGFSNFVRNLYLNEEKIEKNVIKSFSHQRTEDLQLQTVMKYVKCHLPQKCRVLCCVSRTIVGTSIDSCPFMANLNLQSISALLLPPLPDVQLFPFTVSSPDFIIKGINIEYGVLQKCGLFDLSVETNIRCIIIFATSIESNCLNCIIDNALKKYKYDIIVGGDCENHSSSHLKIFCNGFPFFSGIAFTGDNLQIRCVVFRQSYCCVRSQFECLKNRGIPENNTIAFLFAEWPAPSLSFISTFFHKFFQKVALYGIMSNNLIFKDRLSIRVTDDCHYCNNGVDEQPFGLPFPVAAIIVLISFI